MVSDNIPVVDLGKTGLEFDYKTAPVEEKERVVKELADAFMNIGFVYIKNHGIPQYEIDEAFDVSKEYFSLPKEKKEQDAKVPPNFEGYLGPGTEKFGEGNKMEYRESYNFLLSTNYFPKDFPRFEAAFRTLFSRIEELVPRMLQMMALGAGLSEGFFLPSHMDLTKSVTTAMRILHYPPLPDDVSDSERLGAHTDYETMAFLFQDDTGGLQVKHLKHGWIEAKPKPGTILVNAADLLEIWTGGKFKSTVHRVPTPNTPERRKTSRYSIATFIAPDKDTVVEPVTGDKEKYKSTTAFQHIVDQIIKNHNY